jgi:hypothetical protein
MKEFPSASTSRKLAILASLCLLFAGAGCEDTPHRDSPFETFNDASTDLGDEDGGGDIADVDDLPDTTADVEEGIEDADSDDDDSGDAIPDVGDSEDTDDLNDGDAEDLADTEVDDGDAEELADADVDDGSDFDVSDLDDGDMSEDLDDGETVEPSACDQWESVSDAQLRDQLETYVTESHEWVGESDSDCYRWARTYMYGIADYGFDGEQPIDSFNGFFEGVYTGITVPDTPENRDTTPGGIFNTEHSWPQSEGADGVPTRCDIHHLFPADGATNSQRSNYEFGETECGPPSPIACSCCEGGSEVGTSVDSSSQTVFQVRTERQGDIARAHFYFAIRYDRLINSREEAVLRQWHENDPVVGDGETAPSREQIRNDRIEEVQNNRNPFVDCPALVDRISNF